MVEVEKNEGLNMPDTPNSPELESSAVRIHAHTAQPSHTPEPTIFFPPHWSPSRPIILDVGCHRGTFLVALAEARPDCDILGIERQTERVARVLRKISRLSLPNAWAVQGEAHETLKRLPAARAAEIHILFPDPWPKRRHAIRRLVSAAFLAECARVLRPDGLLRIVTDDAPYYKQICNAVKSKKSFQLSENEEPEVPRRGAPLLVTFPLTEFQKKFIEQGKPFYELCTSIGGAESPTKPWERSGCERLAKYVLLSNKEKETLR